MRKLLFTLLAVLALAACHKEPIRDCDERNIAYVTVVNNSDGVLSVFVGNYPAGYAQSGDSCQLEVPAGFQQIGGYVGAESKFKTVELQPCDQIRIEVEI